MESGGVRNEDPPSLLPAFCCRRQRREATAAAMPVNGAVPQTQRNSMVLPDPDVVSQTAPIVFSFSVRPTCWLQQTVSATTSRLPTLYEYYNNQKELPDLLSYSVPTEA